MKQAKSDLLSITGNPKIWHYDKDMQLIQLIDKPNLVVQTGKQWVASRLIGTSQAAVSHIGVGTGTTAPAAGNTTLQTELTRVALDKPAEIASATVTYTATFGPGSGSGALTEAGLFNASSNGTLISRIVYSVVNKGPDDTLIIEWQVTAN